MKRLKDFVEIDKRFQNSINLQLDLQDDTKLESYIPTKSSLLILQKYLKSVMGQEKEKATILIGPYGKGKSHLLLVLLQILSAPENEKVNDLVQRISKLDAETAELVEQYRSQEKKFLPVIVSSSNMNLSDAFVLGLTEALQYAGLSDIVPDSYYKEAEKAADNWMENYPKTYQKFAELMHSEHGRFIEQWRKQMDKMQEDALEAFREIYPKVTSGSQFQPIVNIETMKVYEGINRILCEKYGYAGIFLVFDEFSKYVEGHEEATFARDMKVLQDMCELANSGKEEIHIVCVAHKSIKEYGHQLSKNIKDAFDGVEGRLKEVRFVVSAKNNFELVMDAIHKDIEECRRVAAKNAEWKKVLEDTYQLPCISALFEQEEYDTVVKEGCFPLLPLTVYLLLGVSEKVAQNERSVFTFLANNEPGSLVRLIEEDEKEAHGIGAAVVYDYFSRLFRENTDLIHIHAEWLKAEYALGKAEYEEEKNIIKVMALLKMMGNEEELPVNDESIYLASGLEYGIVKEKLKQLKEAQLIQWRNRTASFDFKNNVGVDIEKKIQEEIQKQKKVNIEKVLGEIAELDYVLPKQYNQEFTMTRYFHYEYKKLEQFLALKKAEYLFEEKPADGKIIALTDADKTTDMEKVQQHLKELKDERIVVLIPREPLMEEENIRRLIAVRQLKEDKTFLEENAVLQQELQLYEEDLIYEINAALEKRYLPENGNCTVLCGIVSRNKSKSVGEFNRTLSRICEEYYNLTPKINNEMINRRKVSSQTKRARRTIVDAVLNGKEMAQWENGSAAEATIYRATLRALDEGRAEEGSQQVLQEIMEYINRCAGKKHSFSELYESLSGKGYGVREGIIPIYIARQIAELEDTPVILLQEREVEITPEIFDNIEEHPENYSLYVEKETVNKEKYIKQLEEIFCGQDTYQSIGKRNRLYELVRAMQRWYRSLPQIAVSFQICPEGMDEEAYAFIKGLRRILKNMEPNPREMLFEQLPGLVEKKNLKETARQIKEGKEYLDTFLFKKNEQAIEVTKKIYGAAKEDSLSGVLKAWYEEQGKAAKSFLASNQVTALMGYLSRMQTHNEQEIVEHLSKAVLDIYMEDWRDESLKQYEEELARLKAEIEHIGMEQSESGSRQMIEFTGSDGKKVKKFYEAEDDSTTYFLKNAMEEAMEEFGDSLEVNQKVAVLVQMIEKLTK